MTPDIRWGDALVVLRELPDASVHCVVTSPPYWGLREYGADGQLGLEPTLEEYIAKLVEVFREVRRVLRDDGTCWVNLGDAYAGSGKGYSKSGSLGSYKQATNKGSWSGAPTTSVALSPGLKFKDLIGLPWLVAFALRADGWWLRQENIWSKPNPMPESADDRTTRSHEQVFMLAKSGEALYWTHRERPGTRTRPQPDYRWQKDGEERDTPPKGWSRDNKMDWRRVNLWRGHDYYYDADAIREPAKYGLGLPDANGSTITGAPYSRHTLGDAIPERERRTDKQRGHARRHGVPTVVEAVMTKEEQQRNGANKRSVWTIATQPTPVDHYATFPEALVKPCVQAGTSERGCCAECGAPWERTTEQHHEPHPNRWSKIANAPGDYSLDTGLRAEKGSSDRLGVATITETTGWRPTCGHQADVAPCVVLDPFAGTGTTGVVAQRAGRRSILIDISPRYDDIMRERFRQGALPLFEGSAS